MLGRRGSLEFSLMRPARMRERGFHARPGFDGAVDGKFPAFRGLELTDVARAASVSCTPRPARRNNSTPRYSSRLFTWWLTAACVMESSFAASLNDIWRAAASNTRNALRGGSR